MSNLNDVKKRSTPQHQSHWKRIECDVKKRSTPQHQSHWKRIECEAAEESTNHPSGIKKHGYVSTIGASTERLEGSSRSVKVSSKGIENDRMLVSDVFKDGQDDGVNLELNLGFARSVEHCKIGAQNTPLLLNTSAAAKGKIVEGASNDPTKWMRAPSDIVPYEGRVVVVDKGKAPLSAVTKRSQTGKRIIEHVEFRGDFVPSGRYFKAYNWGEFTKMQKPYASNEVLSGHKLPLLPGAATSTEKTLEAEKLLQLQHAEQPDLSNADPGNRLLKRLKLNPSTPLAQGTNFASTSSQVVKVSKLYGGIPRSGAPTTPEKQHGKKPVRSDDDWMKRWVHSDEQGTTVTRPEAEAIRDPQSSQLSVQEKKVPSVKAMALMGRVLTRLQPYEYRKSGSCTVWND